MCFSSSASFSTGAILGVAGLLTITKVKNSDQYIFASIPLFFSIQQFSEGLVWLSLTKSNFAIWESMATNIFLIFAQVVWPIWVPLSIYLLEKDKFRKKILVYILAMGSLLSLYLTYCLLFFPVKAEIISLHIHYKLDFPPAIMHITPIFYFIPTVISPLLSSNKRVPLLGLTIMASYFFTLLFYTNYVISVWCFFSAIISAIVYYIIMEMNSLKISEKEKLVIRSID